jgi:hypothetical protein
LAVALSPVLRDIAGHVIAHPWAGYSVVFLVLFVLASGHPSRGQEPKGDGYLLLAAGLLMELIGIGGGIDRLARPALPLGILGLSRLLGRPPIPAALLVLGIVPVPTFALAPAAAVVNPAMARLAAMVSGALGFSLHVHGATLAAPSGVLTLGEGDSGLTLAILLAGIGWYAGLRRAWAKAPAPEPKSLLRQCARAALRWVPWAIPIQAAGIVVAGILLALGSLTLSRVLLQCGVWALTAALGLLRASQPERST